MSGEIELEECRPDCGACCIAPSISTPMPGLPEGKPAGTPCPHLDLRMRCGLFGKPGRPAACSTLKRLKEMCRSSREEAIAHLTDMERKTKPDDPRSP